MATPRATSQLEQKVFLLLLLLITILFLFLLKPLFAPVFWAGVVGLLFHPVQQHFVRELRGRNSFAALMTLMLCVVVAVLPIVLMLSSVVEEGTALYAKIEAGEINPAMYMDRLQTALPFLQRWLLRFGMDIDAVKAEASTGALAVSSLAAQNILALGQGAFGFVFSLALMLYMAFFLLRDGQQIMDLIGRALPVGDERERLLFAKLAEVTRATVKGTLVVAMVQGALGGFIFWILDIPSPTLWGVAMAIMSLIPAVGAALVWLPFSVYLFVTGYVSSALILAAYGVLVIGLADNVLRPVLVGRDTKLPDWMVLLSTIGGLGMFGINGFVVGPLIAAVFMVFWQIFSREYYHDELHPAGKAVLPYGLQPTETPDTGPALKKM